MTQKESLEQLREIKEMMEKSSRVLSLSGLSGVFAGLFAIIGSFVYYYYSKTYFSLDLLPFSEETFSHLSADQIYFGLIDASIVAILSLIFGMYFTTRKSKKKNISIWQKTTKHLLISLFVPLATGTIFCLLLIKHNTIALLVPSTLIFYGLALVNSSKYTYNEINILGILEIILGFCAIIFSQYTFVFWIFGFGILHIVYGLYMFKKHE